jgi:hypothetical protein
MNKFNIKIFFFGGGGAQFSSLPQAQKTLLSALLKYGHMSTTKNTLFFVP